MQKMMRELEESLRIRKLQPSEYVESFDCGDEDLNNFILNDAPLYRKALLAVTYVVEERESGKIMAYFSLANDRVSLSDFKDKTEFNRFRRRRFVNEKRLKSFPAGKLCRLAVDVAAQDMHLGSYLIDFIKSFFVNDNKTGCRFLTVDAYADVIPFYTKNDFVALDDNDTDARTRLLYFDLNDIADID